MLEQSNILIIDDNRYALDSLSLLLKQEFYKVTALNAPADVMPCIRKNETDVVLLDVDFPPGTHSGHKEWDWLKMIKEFNQDILVVLMVVYGMEKQGVIGMEEGADDFIIKPWNAYKLVLSLKNLLKIRFLERELGQYRQFVDTILHAGKDMLDKEARLGELGFRGFIKKPGLSPGDHHALRAKRRSAGDASLRHSLDEKGNPMTLEDAEKQTIVRVLAMHKGNVSQAASTLSITRATLYAKLDKYGIRK